MDKNKLSSIMVVLFGIGLVVAASMLFQYGQTRWFWGLLPTGILIAVAGAYEFKYTFKQTGQTGAGDTKPMAEYRRKNALLTAPERELYRLLKSVLSSEYFVVLPQIALVSVIDKLTQAGFRNELFRIADFCIADARTTEPLLLVELNDASHRRADRVERDRKVADICFRADMPLITFTPDEARDEAYVRRELRKRL